MGITQKLNMACIRGHVYFMNCHAAYQIWTTDKTHSVIKESDPPNGGFTMLLHVMKMSKTVQIPETTTVSRLCGTHVMQSQPGNGVSCFQSVSGWLPSPDCSTLQLGHFQVPRESLDELDVAKSPPVAFSKHARSGWDQMRMLASPYGRWSTAGINPQPPWHDEVEHCRPWGWTGSACTSVRSDVDFQEHKPVILPFITMCGSVLPPLLMSAKTLMEPPPYRSCSDTLASWNRSPRPLHTWTHRSVKSRQYNYSSVKSTGSQSLSVQLTWTRVQFRRACLWSRVKGMPMHSHLTRRPTCWRQLWTVCVEMLTPTSFLNSFCRVVAFTKGWLLACTTRNQSFLAWWLVVDH